MKRFLCKIKKEAVYSITSVTINKTKLQDISTIVHYASSFNWVSGKSNEDIVWNG